MSEPKVIERVAILSVYRADQPISWNPTICTALVYEGEHSISALQRQFPDLRTSVRAEDHSAELTILARDAVEYIGALPRAYGGLGPEEPVDSLSLMSRLAALSAETT